MNENEIGSIIVDRAIYLHSQLGPGLLESVYETTLTKLLKDQDLRVERQVVIPFEFEGEKFDEGFRVDLIVNQKVIIELKSVENLGQVHKKQLLTYLKLTGLNLGYLLNFNESLMKNGITRIINGNL